MLLWVPWAEDTLFSVTLTVISQLCDDVQWAGHHNRRAMGSFLFILVSGPSQKRHHTNTRTPKCQPGRQRKKHLKCSSSVMKVPSLAGECCSEDLLGGSQDVDIALPMRRPEADKGSLGDQRRLSSLFLLGGYHP